MVGGGQREEGGFAAGELVEGGGGHGAGGGPGGGGGGPLAGRPGPVAGAAAPMLDPPSRHEIGMPSTVSDAPPNGAAQDSPRSRPSDR